MVDITRSDWTYSKCATTSATVRIDGQVESVLGLVSDISMPTRCSPEVELTSWLDGANEPSVGARFAGTVS